MSLRRCISHLESLGVVESMNCGNDNDKARVYVISQAMEAGIFCVLSGLTARRDHSLSSVGEGIE